MSAHQILHQILLPHGQCIEIVKGDIFQETVDAIVNSEANSQLLLGGTLFEKHCGDSLNESCKNYVQKNGKVNESQCVVTHAGDLSQRIKYVIHTLGVQWSEKERAARMKQLADSVFHVLETAHMSKFQTIAMSAFFTENYGFPPAVVAPIMLESLNHYFQKHRKSETTLKAVRVIVNRDEVAQAFVNEYNRLYNQPKTSENDDNSDPYRDHNSDGRRVKQRTEPQAAQINANRKRKMDRKSEDDDILASLSSDDEEEQEATDNPNRKRLRRTEDQDASESTARPSAIQEKQSKITKLATPYKIGKKKSQRKPADFHAIDFMLESQPVADMMSLVAPASDGMSISTSLYADDAAMVPALSLQVSTEDDDGDGPNFDFNNL